MQQNGTFEGGRGPDPGGALERVSQIHVDEPVCRGNLDIQCSRFSVKPVEITKFRIEFHRIHVNMHVVHAF